MPTQGTPRQGAGYSGQVVNTARAKRLQAELVELEAASMRKQAELRELEAAAWRKQAELAEEYAAMTRKHAALNAARGAGPEAFDKLVADFGTEPGPGEPS